MNWELEGILVHFLVDVEVDVGVIDVVCSDFWAYGNVVVGVCGNKAVSVGGVPTAGVRQAIGRLLLEEAVAMEGEWC